MKSMILKRNHFKLLKDPGYYSFIDKELDIEIAMEPCLSGFDVALYKIHGDMPHGTILRPKICTDDKDYDFTESITLQERRKDTWDTALKIANMFYKSWKAHKAIQKYGLVEVDEYKFDDQF